MADGRSKREEGDDAFFERLGELLTAAELKRLKLTRRENIAERRRYLAEIGKLRRPPYIALAAKLKGAPAEEMGD